MKIAHHHRTLRNRIHHLRHHPTDAEHELWRHLRSRQCTGAKFRRQHPLGPFIVDFFCLHAGLVVELDGGQHTTQMQEDRRRTAWLARQGYRVLRFWNHDVFDNLDGVLATISEALKTPHPGPLPAGEGVREGGKPHPHA